MLLFGGLYEVFIRVLSAWDCVGTTPGWKYMAQAKFRMEMGTGMMEPMTKQVTWHM